MALIDYRLLQHKMESAGASEFGPDPVESGTTTYSVVKFNNGQDCAAPNHLYWTNVIADPSKGVVTFWAKMNFDSSNSGYCLALGDLTDSIQLFYWSSPNDLYIYFNGAATFYRFDLPAFSNGDKIFFAIAWNAGAAAGDKIRLSVNKITIVPYTYTESGWSSGIKTLATKEWGSPISITADNLKYYSDDVIFADAILNDYDYEGYGAPVQPPPTGLTASDGSFTTHCYISWTAAAGATQYKLYRSSDNITFAELSAWQSATNYQDTSAVAGELYYYKAKASDGSMESVLSNTDSGYRQILELPPDVPEDILLTPAKRIIPSPVSGKPKVLVTSELVDIYDKGYVDEIINLKERKNFDKNKLIINKINLNVKNFDDFFSVESSLSPFSRRQWRFEPIKIYDEYENLIWDGVINNISRNHGTKIATIVSTDILKKYQITGIEYESADWESPAEAIKNICDNIGFTGYNSKSFNDSINILENAGCFVKCNFNRSDDCTFQQAIEKLAEFGCSYIYTMKNEIHFQAWRKYSGGTGINIRETDIISGPIVEDDFDSMINDFRIGYFNDGGVPAVDSANNKIGTNSRSLFGTRSLPPFNGTENQQIKIRDLAAALYIGETKIRMTHRNLDANFPRPLLRINFELPLSFKSWVDVSTYFNLTYKDEDFSNKVFEVFESTINYDRNKIGIVAYETETTA